MIIEENNLPQLPKGWVWTRLAKVGVVASGGTPSTKDEGNFGGEIPWLTPADLTNFQGKFISRGKRNLTKRGLDSSSAVLLPSGTILFSSRAPIGYVAIAGNPISTNQGFKNLVPFDGIFDEFVFYYLRSSKQLAESYASGTTFSEISGTRFSQLPFPLPPLPEQHRIIAKIEELFTRLDAGIDALNKIKLQLKRYRQSVLKSAFEGKLTADWREAHKDELEPASVLLERIKAERKQRTGGKYKELPQLDTSDLPELPKGWIWTTLGDIRLDKSRTIVPNEAPDEIFELYSVPSFASGKPEIVFSKEIGSNKQTVEKDTVLLCKINPRINRVWIVGDYSAQQQIASTEWLPFSKLQGMEPKYLRYFMGNNSFREFLALHTSGVGGSLMRINANTFAQYPFPFPPLLEQHKIVEEIERCFSVADEIEKDVGQSLKQAERLRQSILKRAFEGKLVPQDPTDEPAEKLLEHIRAERARIEAEKKATGKTRRS